jgi:hypothetical protein
VLARAPPAGDQLSLRSVVRLLAGSKWNYVGLGGFGIEILSTEGLEG